MKNQNISFSFAMKRKIKCSIQCLLLAYQMRVLSIECNSLRIIPYLINYFCPNVDFFPTKKNVILKIYAVFILDELIFFVCINTNVKHRNQLPKMV